MTNNTTAPALTDEQRIARQLLDDSAELSTRGYRVTAENMERAAALLTSPRAAVPAPEGWKLVPIKPTDEMVEAGHAEYERALIGNRKDIGAAFLRRWAAMLDAAPAAPVAELVMQPLTDAALREALDDFELVCENNDVRRLTDDEKYAAQEFALSLIHGDPSATQAVAADGSAIDTKAIAESLERMIVDWYADCERTRLDWRQMAGVIKLRLDRFLKRAAVSPATADAYGTVSNRVVWINGETLREVWGASCIQRVYLNSKRTDEDDTPLYVAKSCKTCGRAGLYTSHTTEGPDAKLQSLIDDPFAAAKAWRKPATADERAAFETRTHQRLKQLVGDEAASMVTFGDGYDSDYVSAAWIGWQAGRASQAAAPAEAREPIYQCRLINTPAWIDASRTEFDACATNPDQFETRMLSRIPADAAEAVANVDETTFKRLFYKHGGPVDSEGWCINESGLRDFLADLAAVQGAQGGKGGEA
ncbi:hypothetical protein [Burkholderia gladioli]|uniref:hypothetical protein n=1 Tax=Burkholderia gladioli TaxID=28095 RepID=UPI001640B5AF|nr:hypothetical protein [Burkholderia gladioli]